MQARSSNLAEVHLRQRSSQQMLWSRKHHVLLANKYTIDYSNYSRFMYNVSYSWITMCNKPHISNSNIKLNMPDTISQLQQLQPSRPITLGASSTPEVSPWKSVVNPLMRTDTTCLPRRSHTQTIRQRLLNGFWCLLSYSWYDSNPLARVVQASPEFKPGGFMSN